MAVDREAELVQRGVIVGGRNAPDRRSRHVISTRSAERLDECLAAPEVLAEDIAIAHRRRADRAIDLAARLRLLVHERSREAVARRLRCRRETGRSGTDHDDVVTARRA